MVEEAEEAPVEEGEDKAQWSTAPLTAQEGERGRKIFELMDADGNGKLDTSELRQVLGDRGMM
jgi:Ca2+-binding EF-hand superfamily protein